MFAWNSRSHRVTPPHQQRRLLGEPLRARDWELLVHCKSVRVSGNLVEGWEERDQWEQQSCNHAMVPSWRSHRAIEKLGHHLIQGVEELRLTFSNLSTSETMTPVLVLTQILLKSQDRRQQESMLQTITVTYLQDADPIYWRELSGPLLKYQPQTLQEIRFLNSYLRLETIAPLRMLVATLPNLQRLAFRKCSNLSVLVNDALVEVVAFHLEDFSIFRSNLGDEQIQNLFTGIVAQEDKHAGVILKLCALRLEKIGMTGETVPSLISLLQHATALHTLDLSINELGDDGGQLIASYLQDNPTGSLKKLLLKRTSMGDATLASLAKSIQNNTSLIEFAVSSFELGIDALNAFLETISRNQSLKHLELGQFYLRFDLTPEHQLEHDRLLNNTTLTTLRFPRVTPLLQQKLNVLCARNSIVGKLFPSDRPDADAATWPVGLFPDMLAHVSRIKDGASILHYLLRSKRVPHEALFLLH